MEHHAWIFQKIQVNFVFLRFRQRRRTVNLFKSICIFRLQIALTHLKTFYSKVIDLKIGRNSSIYDANVDMF